MTSSGSHLADAGGGAGDEDDLAGDVLGEDGPKEVGGELVHVVRRDDGRQERRERHLQRRSGQPAKHRHGARSGGTSPPAMTQPRHQQQQGVRGDGETGTHYSRRRGYRCLSAPALVRRDEVMARSGWRRHVERRRHLGAGRTCTRARHRFVQRRAPPDTG
jgi:hypothetical protein